MDENRFKELEEEFNAALDEEFREEEESSTAIKDDEKSVQNIEPKLFVLEEYYTEKDYLDYCKYRYLKTRKWLKVVWIIYLLFALYQIIDSAVKQSVLLLIISAILFGVGVWMLLWGSYYIPYRRTLKQSKNFFAKRIITFYENHLECDADGNVRSTNYKNLTHIFETSKAFYLIIGKDSVLMIFKNAVTQGSAEELSSFLHRVADRINA